jgi:hypothetical protein
VIRCCLDVILKLEDARYKNNNLLPGEMIMRFWTEDTASAGSAATAAARQAVANGLGSGNSATKSLETVVSKLKLFVSIANEAAQVQYIILSSVLVIYFFTIQIHPYVNIVWKVTTTMYQVRMVFHVRGLMTTSFCRS